MSKVDLKTNEEQLKRVRDAVLNDGTTKKYALFGNYSVNQKSINFTDRAKPLEQEQGPCRVQEL